MSAITDFLSARFAEEERTAREVCADGRWHPQLDAHGAQWWVSDRAGGVARTGSIANSDSRPIAEHIARNDPARILAGCEARRRILALHPCDRCGAGDDPCETLLLMALPYAGHPHFSPDWAAA